MPQSIVLQICRCISLCYLHWRKIAGDVGLLNGISALTPAQTLRLIHNLSETCYTTLAAVSMQHYVEVYSLHCTIISRKAA